MMLCIAETERITVSRIEILTVALIALDKDKLNAYPFILLTEFFKIFRFL